MQVRMSMGWVRSNPIAMGLLTGSIKSDARIGITSTGPACKHVHHAHEALISAPRTIKGRMWKVLAERGGERPVLSLQAASRLAERALASAAPKSAYLWCSREATWRAALMSLGFRLASDRAATASLTYCSVQRAGQCSRCLSD